MAGGGAAVGEATWSGGRKELPRVAARCEVEAESTVSRVVAYVDQRAVGGEDRRPCVSVQAALKLRNALWRAVCRGRRPAYCEWHGGPSELAHLGKTDRGRLGCGALVAERPSVGSISRVAAAVTGVAATIRSRATTNARRMAIVPPFLIAPIVCGAAGCGIAGMYRMKLLFGATRFEPAARHRSGDC